MESAVRVNKLALRGFWEDPPDESMREFILSASEEEMRDVGKHFPFCPLRYAIELRPDLVQELLCRAAVLGADLLWDILFQTDIHGKTALYYAMRSNHPSAEIMLEIAFHTDPTTASALKNMSRPHHA